MFLAIFFWLFFCRKNTDVWPLYTRTQPLFYHTSSPATCFLLFKKYTTKEQKTFPSYTPKPPPIFFFQNTQRLSLIMSVMCSEDPPVALDDSSPQTAYQRRKGEVKTTLHWGQRKLLMSEIDFLTRFGLPSDTSTTPTTYTVVYAGAAPATHMPYISELFPEIHFVLVDPNPFDIAKAENIEIINDYFSTALAKTLRARFSKSTVLFISDIRTADWKEQTQEEYLKFLNADNAAQAEWSEAIGATHSMLKFALPYGEGSSQYLKGEVHLPVWGPQTTTECRLIVTHTDSDPISYDHTDHEERMFHFNTVTRTTTYSKHKDINGVGYDHRYDCTREIDILLAYVDKTGLGCGEDVEELVTEMSCAISKQCSRKGYTLATHPLNPFCEERSKDNPHGQKRRRVEQVAIRRVPHPCSDSLTQEKGGEKTKAHVVLKAGETVVMKDHSKATE